MDLGNFLIILARRKWIILLTTILTLLIVTIYSFLATPIYEATTTLRIASASAATSDYNEFLYADRLINTYAKLATSIPVRDDLIHRLSLNEDPQITVQVLPATELIQISVANRDPIMAATIAYTLGNILTNQDQNLYLGGRVPAQDVINVQLSEIEAELQKAQNDYETLSSQPVKNSTDIEAAKQVIDSKQRTYLSLLDQYEQNRVKAAVSANVVSVVDPVQIPLSPARPNKGLNIILGLLVGLTGGFGLGLVKENLDTRIYSTQQIEELSGLPILAIIPKAREKSRFMSLIGNLPPADEFRSLRMKLLIHNTSQPIKTLLITSSDPNEGKSTILVNLAYTFVQFGRKVVIIDGNLRDPVLHTNFNVAETPGLTNYLKQSVELEKICRPTPVPGLFFIPAGPKVLYPAELLESDGMRIVLSQLASKFDLILIDSPAVQAEIDATIMASSVDAVLLVTSLEHVRRNTLLSALKSLRNMQSNLIGIVVNNSTQPNRRIARS